MKTIEAFLSDLRRRDINLWLDGNDLCYKAPSQTLTPALIQELKERKAEILTFLHNANATTHSNLPPILPASRDKDLPLSFAQQRLWFLNQLEPNSCAYNMPAAYRLTGQLNITALEQSLNEIIRRHEVLRITFPAVDGQPSQAIAPTITLTLPLIDLGEHPETEREVIAQQIATQEAQQPFNLAQEPLFRAKLLHLTEAEHMLLLNMHHIISDGWSFDVFFRELAAFYTVFFTGKPSPLPELPLQYADFAHWQREWLQGEVLESQLNYWKQQLSGSLPILQLPTDHPRSPVQTYQGAYQYLELSKDLTEALKALSQQEGVTLFMTLLAAFQTLLYRYSGQEDIIVGTPIAGRNQVKTDGLIGFFVNTLVMRTDLSGKPSFRQLLAQVREVALGAYAHQNLPFEKLVEKLQPERNLSRSPLFQVMFAFQNTPGQPWELPGLTITPLEVHSGTSKFDLTLDLKETSEGIKGGIEYNTDLFEAATITRMVGHFQTLLESIVANPDQPIWELPLLTTTEQHQLLVERHNTQTDYPNNNCIHQLFDEQVERTPNTIAAIFENQLLTYQQLNHRANQLAHYLQALGVGKEVLVGICMERSLEMVVGLLGILKAGGAYVPLDPAYPTEQLAFMVEDTQISVLLTQTRLVQSLPPHQAQVVCLDTQWQEIVQNSKENPISAVMPDNLAYVIYTSGSTGRPKGVAMSHCSLSNLIIWQQESSTLPIGAKTLQFAPLSFDVSFQEIFSTWISGGTLVLISKQVRVDPFELLRFLAEQEINRFFLPFVALQQLAEVAVAQGSVVPTLREIITAGEQLQITRPIASWFTKLQNCTLHNHYGPSESHVVTAFTLTGSPSDWPALPPIGRPIANTQIYLLDEHLQPVPVGVPGELYIGGAGLARGYLNRPELTAQRFMANPFSQKAGERIYKTGDLARYLPDGNIEFLDRIDNQVKIRGFRIELGEVESTLSQYPTVEQCVVTARVDCGSDKRLVAYIVSNQQQKPTTDELRCFLKQKLPEYMVPSAFVFLDTIPLTPNGKIDQRALPAPDGLRQEPVSTFVPPGDDLEIQLTKIWENVLGKKPISVKDNFFDLGGHSLLTVRLLAQIKKAFGKNLPLAALFQAPTVEQLASILRQKGHSKLWSALAPIQPHGSKPPIFLFQGIGIYRALASHLGSEQPVYGLSIEMMNPTEVPLNPIELATHYIKEMRIVQPQGPFFLGGLCFGGMVALEVAQQLHAEGQKVALLALLDTPGLGAYTPKPIHKQVFGHLSNLLEFGPAYGLKKLNNLSKKLQWIYYKFFQANGLRGFDNTRYKTVQEAYGEAQTKYVPQAYSGRVTLFVTSVQTTVSDSLYDPKLVDIDIKFGWGELAVGGLDIYEVPGGHLSMLQEPHVQVLAEKLKACIDRVQAEELAHIPSLCSDPLVCDNEEPEG